MRKLLLSGARVKHTPRAQSGQAAARQNLINFQTGGNVVVVFYYLPQKLLVG